VTHPDITARVRPRIVVVGLGPGDPGLVSVQTAAAIEVAAVRFARTSRHPSVSLLGPPGTFTTFDDVYESAARLDDVYPEIVERLVAAAARYGEIVYAVPGSPLVAERTVELLRVERRVEVEIHPAMSFLDLAWHRLGVDPVATGAQMVDGQRFARQAAGLPGPLLVSQCDSSLVLSDIKLTLDEGPDVTVLARLGLPDESVSVVAWDDLDRLVAPDHLTTLWIPALAAPVAAELVRLDELMHILRERCPWDRRQTHQSLTRHLLEETYEVLEAIELETVRSHGYCFQIELTQRALQAGFAVREVPIVFRDRRHGHSKMSPRIAIEAFLVLPQLRWGRTRR